MPRGFNVHYARDVKKAFPNLLVNTVGSITSLDIGEEILVQAAGPILWPCAAR